MQNAPDEIIIEPESPIELSDLPKVRALQLDLVAALTDMGHAIEKISAVGSDQRDFTIFTNKIQLRVETGRQDEPGILIGEMDVMKTLQGNEEKRRRKILAKAEVQNQQMLIVQKLLDLPPKKERQFLDELRKRVFEFIDNKAVGSTFRKFRFKYKIKTNPIEKTMGTTQKEIIENLPTQKAAEPDDEDLTMTIENGLPRDL